MPKFEIVQNAIKTVQGYSWTYFQANFNFFEKWHLLQVAVNQ